VSTNTVKNSEEKCRDVSSETSNVVAQHPAATFYKSRFPGMFNLSKSRGRSQLQHSFVKIRAAELRRDDVAHLNRLLNFVRAAVFASLICRLSWLVETMSVCVIYCRQVEVSRFWKRNGLFIVILVEIRLFHLTSLRI